MRKRFVDTVVLGLLLWMLHGVASIAAPAANPQDATVFIKVFVEGPAPVTEEIVKRLLTTGSGVLVSAEGTVVTAKHVTSHRIGPQDRLVFEGALRASRTPTLWPLDFKAESATADVAVLSFPRDFLDQFPYLCVLQGGSLDLVAKGLGFPGGGNFATRPGGVTAQADEKGRVQVGMGLAKGMSGGPILTNDNHVVGIIAGGLEGMSSFDYFTPIDRASSLLQDFPASKVGEAACESRGDAQPPAGPIEARFRVDETNDLHPNLTSEHTETYTVVQHADDGYLITGATLLRESDTRVSGLSVIVAPDGKSVTLTFKLTAGPMIDQYRGWLHGELVVTMEAET